MGGDSPKSRVVGQKKAIVTSKVDFKKQREMNFNVKPFNEGLMVVKKDTKMTISLDRNSRESLIERENRLNTNNSNSQVDNLDLRELEEINFPGQKPVRVRKKIGLKKGETTKRAQEFIKVQNRGTE